MLKLSLSRYPILAPLISLILAISLVMIWWKIDLWSFLIGSQPLWDFDVYYATAQAARAGISPYQVPFMQTAGPPLVVAVYLPFTYLPLSVARAAVTFINLSAGALSCWMLSKLITGRFRISGALALLNLLWLSFPARFSLLLGQPNLVLLLAVTTLLLHEYSAAVTNKFKLLGIPRADQWVTPLMLALAALVKTNFLVLFASTLRHSHLKFVWAVTALLVVAILAVPILKVDYYVEYLTQRAHHYTRSAVELKDVDYYNQSLRSTLGRFNLGSLAPQVFMFTAVLALVYLLVTGDVGAGVALSLLSSPIVWQHYLVAVYPLLFFELYWLVKANKWRSVAAVCTCGLLMMTELPWLHGRQLGGVNSLLASHYFIGLVGTFFLWTVAIKSKSNQ